MIFKNVYKLRVNRNNMQKNGQVTLFVIVGLVILFSSGLIFKEFDPLDELEENVTKVLSHIYRYPQKHHFRIKYFDRIKQRHIKFSGSIIKKIEKSYLIVKHKSGKELFIPMHRIKKVSKKGKTFWKAKA